MYAFRFDGSFEGLLSAVFDAYAFRRFPGVLLRQGDVPPLTAHAIHDVATGRDKAERVRSGLEKRISPEARDDVMRVWLAETPEAPDILFRYMRLVFDTPEGGSLKYIHRDVYAVRELARKVAGEAHLLNGFVRFQKTAQGVYFASLGPRYNVIPLMLPHFAGRMADCSWILYDHGRSYGVHYAPDATPRFGETNLCMPLTEDGRLDEALLAEDEAACQGMWRKYFRATAVPERVNPRLQARCLPRRFWKYLTEMQS